MKRTIVILSLLLSGCARDVQTPSQIELTVMNNRNKWMALAYQVEKRYDTTGWTTEEIAAELYFADYKLNKERDGR